MLNLNIPLPSSKPEIWVFDQENNFDNLVTCTSDSLYSSCLPNNREGLKLTSLGVVYCLVSVLISAVAGLPGETTAEVLLV